MSLSRLSLKVQKRAADGLAQAVVRWRPLCLGWFRPASRTSFDADVGCLRELMSVARPKLRARSCGVILDAWCPELVDGIFDDASCLCSGWILWRKPVVAFGLMSRARIGGTLDRNWNSRCLLSRAQDVCNNLLTGALDGRICDRTVSQ